jgi:hypothetical protein
VGTGSPLSRWHALTFPNQDKIGRLYLGQEHQSGSEGRAVEVCYTERLRGLCGRCADTRPFVSGLIAILAEVYRNEMLDLTDWIADLEGVQIT